MNDPFAEATLAFVAGSRVLRKHWEGRAYDPGQPLDARAYGERIEHLLGLYVWGIQLGQMNLLDSHDAARVVTLESGDRASAHLATLLLVNPGAVSAYYGDEIGLAGRLPDYQTRASMPGAGRRRGTKRCWIITASRSRCGARAPRCAGALTSANVPKRMAGREGRSRLRWQRAAKYSLDSIRRPTK
ncbi:MAG: hypothetical protein IT318_11185 [Anaerolineales bacterium]|nr:hypothetical protein [Anaerolineales bacterium]